MRLLACVVALATPVLAGAQPRSISADAPGWTIRDGVRVERVGGVPALVFRSGTAYFHDITFKDGAIAFDLATTSRRSFIGLRFRAASEERFEEIYFRPHKSGLPDAVQYAPAFVAGRSQWQLYHGPAHTASTTFQHLTWTRVRVIVRDRRAAVFLGDAATPVMVVDRLAHDPAPGFIGFGSFDDGEVKPGERTTAIANIVVRPDEIEHDFAAARAATVPPGLIREWEVSAPFVAPDGAVQTLPPEVLAGPWRPAPTEPDGLLLFDRVIAPPEGARRATALARVTIPATRATTLRLSLGFSDDVSVFLNGTLLYSGVNGYSYNFPRRDGLITIDQASLYLPLRQGPNSLVFAVSDTFGGWGLIAQTIDDGGNHVRAR